jgi:hypothetical protein
MRMRTVMALLLLAPLANAQEGRKFDDIVEVSPGLFLLMYTARAETYVGLRLDAIRRANDFAASRGGAVVPVMGRQSGLGPVLKLYEYQFRVMSVDQARAAQPVLADAVITVNNTGQCAPGAAVGALWQGAPVPDGLRVVAAPMTFGAFGMSTPDSAPAESSGPGTFCLPGQICQPAQMCLPGWECSPGMPPSVAPPKPVTPPAG